MRAHVVTTRFAVTPDGRLWHQNAILGYGFWKRYLDVYDEVHLVCFGRPVRQAPDGWHEATGPGVSSSPLPDMQGPFGFARGALAVSRGLRQIMASEGAVHLRGPSVLCNLAALCIPAGKPFGLEIAGDPYDSFAPGAFKGILRPVYRAWFLSALRRQCLAAHATAYVTEAGLQVRFPPNVERFSTSYSSIDLVEEAFHTRELSSFVPLGVNRIVHVGTQGQLYKGPDVLIRAAGILVRKGCSIHLTLVGDGRFREELEQLAQNEIPGAFSFTGHLSSAGAVRAALDSADLFVLPSHQEGLPKALIEAMARGLPAISTHVGGIPELLPKENLVEPGNVVALASAIDTILQSKEVLWGEGLRNASIAQRHKLSILRPRRIAFYSEVERATNDYAGSNR